MLLATAVTELSIRQVHNPLFSGICAAFSLIVLFYAFGLSSSREHIFENTILLISELLLLDLMLLFTSPFFILPFLYLYAVQLVLNERPRLVTGLFISFALVTMTTGVLIRGTYRDLILLPFLTGGLFLLVKTVEIKAVETLKAYEYMKNLVDNKNKLLSTLTHELRTPLAVIRTSNELVMEERPGPLNSTQKALVSSSLENTKRLNALVENILSQVKVEFAWFDMKRQPLDLRKIIRKTAIDIKPFLDSKQQKLKYNYPSLLSKTLGDRRWLEQVLLNLIHNGSKNSTEGAEITVQVQENEQCLVVSVHDSGSGIEKREIPHVFNEFYQSTDPARNHNEGAGLGLTIVRDIIKKHKGEVYISSIPGSGTTVSFTLPRYKGVFSGTNHTDN